MGTKRINGLHLEKMVQNGLANLQLQEEKINKLNVFPVPDGDTGTNMCLTLENGVKYAHSCEDAGAYLKLLSDGMLLGARGNSGVILSQFFKGVYLELSRCSYIGPGELRNGLIRGYRVAYESVVQPVEGTILTVTREGIEHIRSQITRNTTIETILSMYIAEMRKSLSYTPEMLSVLKEAGVVDSGAKGFIIIVEGMLKYLYGKIVKPKKNASVKDSVPQINPELFNEYSAFDDGYCLEFILQLLRNSNYNQRFQVSRYIEDLKACGESLVVVQDGKRVKVHIHTLKPAKVITLSQEFGEFLTFKMDNMQVQHNEHTREDITEKKHKLLSVVSVVNGEGLKDLFSELGCDVVLDGGPTMNTSAQEFIDAFSQISADEIVVLPNNPNVILAAKQATSIYGASNITVLPTKSYIEGYFALAMDVADSKDTKYRIKQMKNGISDVETLSQTTASRDYIYHEISCKKGDEIILLNNEIVCVDTDWKKCIIDGLKQVPDIEDKEMCMIFRGYDIPDRFEDELSQSISEIFPNLEINVINGGQQIYHWVIGII